MAKLRELKTDSHPVLFRINMDAGHAGASGRFSRLEEVAYSFAFALKVWVRFQASKLIIKPLSCEGGSSFNGIAGAALSICFAALS
ncbi:hypothetical protein [Brucella inopinata]|uniref:hypothetical protein n=1 Tax=Brucella inopinata TaxID=1218315 RepID=UPI000A98ABCC|nr:hypothetical protein [Brucella inopinata]